MDAGSANSPALAAFLADRDQPCPRCGYNLRGVEGAQCPECGERLVLTLERRRRLGGWGPFLVLVFAWLMIAGGINTTREVQRLIRQREAVAQASQRMAAVRSQLQAQIQQMDQQIDRLLGQSLSALDAPDPFWGSDRFQKRRQEIAAQAQRMRQQLMQQQLSVLPAPAQPPPTLQQVWMSGTVVQRASSVWAAFLTVAGLLGLLAVALAALRGRRTGPPVGLIATACSLFAVYAGWHLVLFIRDLG